MQGKEPEESLDSIDALTIFTLLVRCPTGNPPRDSCPFAWLRGEFTLEERFHLAESLPQNKRREMLIRHRHCLARVHTLANSSHHFD